MRRREFGLGILGTAGLLGADAVRGDGASLATTRDAQDGQIGQMLFPSCGGMLNANGEPLTDDSLVAVWAEPTAEINDRDGDGDAVNYPGDVDIPIVTVDDSGTGAVAGVGAMMVNDGDLVPELEGNDPLGDLGNEEFLLNLYDEYANGDQILWDEGHGQFYDLGSFQNFEAYAEDNGYTLAATSDLTADLEGAGAIVITSPADSFTDAELTALSDFVDNGGFVVFHTQSDFSDFDQTGNLNAIAESLGVGFRFNDAEVGDEENNVGIYFLPLTGNFNEDFPLFADREGITIDLRAGREYDVQVDGVADGDTVDVVFSGDDIGLQTDFSGTVRLLGIDTPESAGVAQSAERPEEWEGLAYDLGGEVDPIDELVFNSTASLLNANGEPLTDESVGVVFAEPTATNEDADGNGDAVSYPDDIDIPLAAVDGNVAGFGAPFVDDDSLDPATDNEEFLLNLYDELVNGGTVLWDESHDQFYDLASFSQVESYLEENGYDLQSTGDVTADLGDADGVVITSPSAFSDAELTALSDFVDDGGAVILHSQSDFNDFDQTANLDAVAAALGVSFRFNDDQVVDGENNAGESFIPATSNFDESSPLFRTRTGLDDEDPRTTEYLTDWASRASEFASDLDGQNVTLFFDESEPLRDPTRLLAYIRYDATGDGSRDTLYNKAVIEEGYARAYGSSLSRHDEFWATEQEARQNDRKVWSESDLDDATPYRDRPPQEVFAPVASSVSTAGSEPIEDYATVYAEDTAAQDGASPYSEHIALVGRDTDTRTAVSGSLLVDESYERLEGFPRDTSDYDNFSVVTRTIESLTEEGDLVFVDGGHGQFGTDYGLSAEDMAYYQRHLEGRQVNLEQLNDLTRDRLGDAHALLVTTPASALTTAELDAVTQFRDDGGAVVLMGSAAAPSEATGYLNEVAEALGTPLRVNTDQVVDDENNLLGDETLPTTSQVVPIAGPPALPGRNARPRDLDDDGLFEDLDGDGEFSLQDVRLYFRDVYKQRDSEYVQMNTQYFDVTGDGSITLSDVQALFERLN